MFARFFRTPTQALKKDEVTIANNTDYYITVFTDISGPHGGSIAPKTQVEVLVTQSAKYILAFREETQELVCKTALVPPLISVSTNVPCLLTIRKVQIWWREIRQRRRMAAIARIRPVLIAHVRKVGRAVVRIQAIVRGWIAGRMVACNECFGVTPAFQTTKCTKTHSHRTCWACTRAHVSEILSNDEEALLEKIVHCRASGCRAYVNFETLERVLSWEHLNEYAAFARRVLQGKWIVLQNIESNRNKAQLRELLDLESAEHAFPSLAFLNTSAATSRAQERVQQRAQENRKTIFLFGIDRPIEVTNAAGQAVHTRHLDGSINQVGSCFSVESSGRIVFRLQGQFMCSLNLQDAPDNLACTFVGLRSSEKPFRQIPARSLVIKLAANTIQNAVLKFLFRCRQDCPVCLQAVPRTCTRKLDPKCAHPSACVKCLALHARHQVTAGRLEVQCPAGVQCKSTFSPKKLTEILGVKDHAAAIEKRRQLHGARLLALSKAEDKTWRRIVKEMRVCPFCNVLIQKNMGCHSMRCKCGNFFSWNVDALSPTAAVELLRAPPLNELA